MILSALFEILRGLMDGNIEQDDSAWYQSPQRYGQYRRSLHAPLLSPRAGLFSLNA